jgi:hydroxyacylglutathione hydrolase
MATGHLGQAKTIMAEISMFTGGIAQTNGYLVQTAGLTFLVDAPEGVAAWLKSQGIRLDALLLTHQHFDHVLDAAALAQEHGCPVYAWATFSHDLTLERLYGAVSGASFSVPDFTVQNVLQGLSNMELGAVKIQLFHIPGHSPDSVCFYLPEQGLLFGGDVLFLDGVGRTDFPGGSFTQLATGISRDLWPLPDDTIVYPGHGDDTRIGREREENPFVGTAA